MTLIYVATEDALSERIAESLINTYTPGLRIAVRMGRSGNGYLRKKLPELIRTAQHVPVFLLTDLDDAQCPYRLISDWRNRLTLPENLVFRIAVREVESWILADPAAFSAHFGVPHARIPRNPDTLVDPKRTLLNLVRRYGNRLARQEILPRARSSAMIGVGYNDFLGRFVKEAWAPHRAANRSPSLSKAAARLGEMEARIT